jgi:hypothetical protein
MMNRDDFQQKLLSIYFNTRLSCSFSDNLLFASNSSKSRGITPFASSVFSLFIPFVLSFPRAVYVFPEHEVAPVHEQPYILPNRRPFISAPPSTSPWR